MDIQGLRALAVLAVVLYHAGVPFLSGGYVGVDVFFVISGFLITSHLLTSLRRDGRIHFASFYAKRARRILPAALGVVALSVLAAAIWYPPLLAREVLLGAAATALYVPNYLFAAQGTNYLAETTPSLFQHYWSLGIEEQFYLLWPALLALGFAARRVKMLVLVVTAATILSLTLCVVLTFESQPWAFFGLPTRAWELGAGGIVALVVMYRPPAWRPALAKAIGWTGIVAILACAMFFTEGTPFPGYWAIVPVVATAMVILAGAGKLTVTSRLLSSRPMTSIGEISYSMYLVHWPLLVIPQAAVGFENPLPLWVTLPLGALSIPIAWLLFRYVEQPGRRWNTLTSARPRRTLVLAAAASVTVVALAGVGYAHATLRPLSTSQTAPPTVVDTLPSSTGYVPSNLVPSLRSASDDQPIVYEDGCHLTFEEQLMKDCVYGPESAPRIVLFGDSHAAQWFPAVLAYAEENGYSVENQTKSSCPSVLAVTLVDGVRYRTCDEWRSQVLDRIRADPPAIVVLSNYGAGTLLADSTGVSGWEAALGAMLEEIQAPTVVIADTPVFSATPSVCLSSHLDDVDPCVGDRRQLLAAPTRLAEVAATRDNNARLVDLTDYLCGERCPPILGNTLVYRDAHHLTATFSALLAPALADALK